MPDVTSDRRNAPRYALVLAAEVMEPSRGARLSARTSDLSLTGCYLDTLTLLPKGSQVRISLTHRREVCEASGRVMDVRPGMGMGMGMGMGVGVEFEEIASEHQARLQRWLAAKNEG